MSSFFTSSCSDSMPSTAASSVRFCESHGFWPSGKRLSCSSSCSGVSETSRLTYRFPQVLSMLFAAMAFFPPIVFPDLRLINPACRVFILESGCAVVFLTGLCKSLPNFLTEIQVYPSPHCIKWTGGMRH